MTVKIANIGSGLTGICMLKGLLEKPERPSQSMKLKQVRDKEHPYHPDHLAMFSKIVSDL